VAILIRLEKTRAQKTEQATVLEDEFDTVDQRTLFLVYELGEVNLRECFKRLKFAKSVHEVVGHLS
jgi:hypothetical protein